MTHVKLKYTDGLQFVAESESGHAIVIDGPKDSGGSDSGIRPMELLLVALGGCTAMDVISILQKKKQEVQGLEIHVSGERAKDPPRKYEAIQIEFVLRGRALDERAIQRAIDLSLDKYCSVKATLGAAPDLKATFRVETPGSAVGAGSA